MLSALRDRNLRLYLGGNLLSIIGTWAQRVVIFWIAWDLAESTAVLGLIATLDLAPSLLASPLAGALSDRRPPIRLAIIVQIVSVIPPLILGACALKGMIGVPVLLVMAVCTGFLSGFDHPLRLLLIGNVSRREDISGAIALNSISFNIGRMIGPAVGGVLVSVGQTAAIFGMNALSFVAFAAILARFLPVVEESEDDSPPNPAIGFGIGGWGRVLREMLPLDRRLFLYFALLGLMIRPIFELLPALAGRFATASVSEAQTYSLLTSTQGAGAMLGALISSLVLGRILRERVAVWAGLSAACAVIVFFLSPIAIISVAALAVLSATILTNGIATQVSLQTRLSRDVRGKGLALYTMTLRGHLPLGR